MSKKRKRKDEEKVTAMLDRQIEQSEEELAALAEDCERDMYGDDYDYLRDCGWLDR